MRRPALPRPGRGHMMTALLAVAAAAAVLAVPAPPGSEPDVVLSEITSAALACPELTATDDSAAVVASVVVGARGDARFADGERGSAALGFLGTGATLALVAAEDAPLPVLVAGGSADPVVTRARDAWAPSTLSGVAGRDLSGGGAGLWSAGCPAPSTDWWFVGTGSQVGRGSVLLVTNPASEPARFDVSLHARGGPVQALAGKGIDVPARGHVRVRLAALAPGEGLLAVHLRATTGRVVAGLLDVAVPAEGAPRGIDAIPAAAPPGREVLIAGVPGGVGARELVLVNPGAQFATVTPRLLTATGSEQVEGLAALVVPAGSVVSIDLARLLGGRAGSLHLVSDAPITGGVRAAWGTARRDVAWLAATPRITSSAPLAGAAVVPTGPGLQTTVTVAAPESAVSGVLTITTRGTLAEAIFAGSGGPLADGSLASDDGATTDLLPPGSSPTPQTVGVRVPAGTQLSLVMPAARAAAVATITWRSDPATGPAAVSHVTLDPTIPLATGYPWWPVASYVEALPVRPDVGAGLDLGP